MSLLVEGIFTSCFESRRLLMVAACRQLLLRMIIFEAIHVTTWLWVSVQYLFGRCDDLGPCSYKVYFLIVVIHVALSILLHSEALLEFGVAVLVLQRLVVVHAPSLRLVVWRGMLRGQRDTCPLFYLPRYPHRGMALHAIRGGSLGILKELTLHLDIKNWGATWGQPLVQVPS